MQARRNEHLSIQRKIDGTLVTDVDIAINQLVIVAIAKNFPGHTIIGEEKTWGSLHSDHIWRVDPIDGTGEYVESEMSTNLSYGFGLAKQFRGKNEMGLFLNPTTEELYTATSNQGTKLNGKKIEVGEHPLTPGISYDYSEWDGAKLDSTALRQMLGDPIGNYSAIYQACKVAEGESIFSIFPGSTKHDIAPGDIIVTEANGRVTDLHGVRFDYNSDIGGALFSNGLVHRAVLDILS